jgi:hypothetical protein
MSLCMVSNQERFVIKSGLWWRGYGIQNSNYFERNQTLNQNMQIVLQGIKP